MKRKQYSFLLLIVTLLTPLLLISNLSYAESLTGEGTEESPYLISTVYDFYDLYYTSLEQSYNSSYYKLVNDLDFKGDTIEPISYFNGTLDGAGHTISNMRLSSIDDKNAGLFQSLDGADIKSLKIKDVRIQSSMSMNTGIIAGTSINTEFHDIIIENSSIIASNNTGGICGNAISSQFDSVSVRNSSFRSFENEGIGGVVGTSSDSVFKNSDSTNNTLNAFYCVGGFAGTDTNSTFKQCYSTSLIGGNYNQIGGFLGSAYKSSLYQCFSSGTITQSEHAGGLIGEASNTTIEQCYTSGTINSEINAGGLIGGIIDNYYNSSNTILDSYSKCNIISDYPKSESAGLSISNIETITNCYFAGRITSYKKYPLIPNTNNDVNNSYFDSNLIGLTLPESWARTTKEMQNKANYTNWDFDTVWEIDEGNSYPVLQFEKELGVNKPAPADATSMIVLERTEKLQLSIHEDMLRNEEVEWISSNVAVASVNDVGLVSAHGIGEALITAKSEDGEYLEYIYIMVVEAAANHRLTVELEENASRWVRIRSFDIGDISWHSMDSSIVSVTKRGKATASAKGLTILTADDDYGNEVGQVYIRVK